MRSLTVILPVAFVLAACGGGDNAGESARQTSEPEPTELDHAADCHAELTVEDDGRTLIVQTEGEDIGAVGIPYSTLSCVFRELDLPAGVVARIENTRALDGMQEAEWGDYTAFWTYHPDDGLGLIVETVEDQ